MEAKNDDKNISIEFSKDEALVLLEWLANFNKREDPTLFEDQSEERILFDLEASLEKVVSETFEENYLEILSRARQKLRDPE